MRLFPGLLKFWKFKNNFWLSLLCLKYESPKSYGVQRILRPCTYTKKPRGRNTVWTPPKNRGKWKWSVVSDLPDSRFAYTHATTSGTNHIALKGSHLRPSHKLSIFEISILHVLTIDLKIASTTWKGRLCACNSEWVISITWISIFIKWENLSRIYEIIKKRASETRQRAAPVTVQY